MITVLGWIVVVYGCLVALAGITFLTGELVHILRDRP